MQIPPEEARLRQPFPYGGERWLAAYGRRATVEGSFAGTNDTFTQVSRRGWKRTPGAVKTTLAIGFAVAGYNRRVQRQFRARLFKQEQWELRQRGVRARRRVGVIAELVGDEHRRRIETIRAQWEGRSGGVWTW